MEGSDGSKNWEGRLKCDRMTWVRIGRADHENRKLDFRFSWYPGGIDRLIVVYRGSVRYLLADRVEVVPVSALAAGDLKMLLPRKATARGGTRPRKGRRPKVGRRHTAKRT
jgi:hypothetical protein